VNDARRLIAIRRAALGPKAELSRTVMTDAFSDTSTESKAHPTRRAMLQATSGLGLLYVATALGGAQAHAAAATDIALPQATNAVTPFKVKIPSSALDDLKRRLARTRWPNKETVSDPSQGAQLEKVKALLDYWQSKYDLRRLEKRLNAHPQFRTEIDGLGIHFLHIRSKHESALPLLLTHGWPGSVVEFLKIIGPLTDPEAHGGKAEDAFHVILPSLPGYGFSDKPEEKGWNLTRTARAWGVLMQRLGYTKWVAQGGDWGAGVTTWMAKQHVPGLQAIHLNLPILFPPPLEGAPTPEELAALAKARAYASNKSGYAKLQATRPQTIGYPLADSPAGQAAWIYEKFGEWTDSGGEAEKALSTDEMLDNITLYWLTNTAASSARLYSESFGADFSTQKLDLPVAVSIFPGEIGRSPRIWGERAYSKLYYWNEVAKGGHFAAFEQPQIFVAEVRKAFSTFR
jgi:epoxide hydrolase